MRSMLLAAGAAGLLVGCAHPAAAQSAGSAAAADEFRATRLYIELGTCESVMNTDRSSESLVGTLALLAANYVIDKLFGIAQNHLENRERQLTATYSASTLAMLGIPDPGCIIVVNGSFARTGEGEYSRTVAGVLPSFFRTFGIRDVHSLMAFDVVVEDEASDISLLGVTPYVLEFPRTSAQQRGNGQKSIVAALTFTSYVAGGDKGVQNRSVEFVFDFGRMAIGAQQGATQLVRMQKTAFIAGADMARPAQISASVVETGSDALVARVLADFYKSQSGDLKTILTDALGIGD